jgi:hypothetical protein
MLSTGVLKLVGATPTWIVSFIPIVGSTPTTYTHHQPVDFYATPRHIIKQPLHKMSRYKPTLSTQRDSITLPSPQRDL